MRVAAFTKYDRLAASTRQRVLQYLPSLETAGISVDCHSLLGDRYVQSLASEESPSRLDVARSYLQRMKQLLVAGLDCDVIWVYAEMFPWLPAAFEKLVFRSGKPVVYDLDDAFFHPYDDNSRSWVRRLLGGKIEPLLKGAAACCCGNPYLQDYAAKFSDSTILLPTVVDTSKYTPRAAPLVDGGPVTIGWIGSPSTWNYVRPLLPMLEELARGGAVRFKVVGAGTNASSDRFAGMELVDWSEDREIAEVQAMDIGIMPLPDEQWARGKSGYKLIQYMACGLPTVASPVGANCDIVADGQSGYFAASDAEWREALSKLVSDRDLRRRLGEEGRYRAVADYSLAAHAPRLVEVMRRAVGQRINEPQCGH